MAQEVTSAGPQPGSWDAFSYMASSRHIVGARGHAQTMSLQKDLAHPGLCSQSHGEEWLPSSLLG